MTDKSNDPIKSFIENALERDESTGSNDDSDNSEEELDKIVDDLVCGISNDAP